jgi:hypothetical protein
VFQGFKGFLRRELCFQSRVFHQSRPPKSVGPI